MDNYKLTVTFSDGDVTVEKFNTEAGMERAMAWWKRAEAEDHARGETYTIVSMEPEVLVPEDELV